MRIAFYVLSAVHPGRVLWGLDGTWRARGASHVPDRYPSYSWPYECRFVVESSTGRIPVATPQCEREPGTANRYKRVK